MEIIDFIDVLNKFSYKIDIQFQLFSNDSQRPFDEALNEQRFLALDKFSLIPSTGDYFEFYSPSNKDSKLYMVKSRLFSYVIEDAGEKQEIVASINIVVEERPKGDLSKLIKE